jgi:RNA polymerase sigma factor (sigma-70 family)
MWSVLRAAHSDGGQKQAAQALLVECYGPAVRRYLQTLTRNEHTTDELWQRFMLKLMDGAFRNVAPENGRFRAYVKVTLFHLVAEEFRGRRRHPATLLDGSLHEQPVTDRQTDEERFEQYWRQQLLDRTWSALQDAQPRYYTVLRQRVAEPDQTIEQLTQSLRRESSGLTPTTVRKVLSRARERFAMLLLDEVARSVDPPARERVEAELADLRLLEYCRPALASLDHVERE